MNTDGGYLDISEGNHGHVMDHFRQERLCHADQAVMQHCVDRPSILSSYQHPGGLDACLDQDHH